MSAIEVGNAPCSWGTLEFEGLEGARVGCAQMLDELVETGYTGTELGDWGFMPVDAAALGCELSKRGLAMLGAFVPVALRDGAAHDSGEAEALKVARLLSKVSADAGHKPYVVLADDNGTDPVRTKNAGRVTVEMGLDDAGWETFAGGAGRIARAVREETGLRTVFHHHCAGYIETPEEIDRLLELTDPSLLGLVFDTGHYLYGSGSNRVESVNEGLERFGDRIWYAHFKDCDPGIADRSRKEGWDYFGAVRHGVFGELGTGCVDFPSVLAWLRARDYSGWIVVEQDVLPGMGSPRESAGRNREYLRGIGL